MKKAIVTSVGIFLVPFGLLIPSEIDTWKDKVWATVDIAFTVCYAAIVFVPLCVLGILLLLSNIKMR
jgi:hypothetical protein